MSTSWRKAGALGLIIQSSGKQSENERLLSVVEHCLPSTLAIVVLLPDDTAPEYVAAGSCCARVLWMRNQLLDYHLRLCKIPIYYDSTSAIVIANNPVLHSKTKHIEIRYHFIRDHVMNGDIQLHFIPTAYQLVDLFTKPLDETRFNFLINELGMLNLED
ncbi:hypothetical protein L6452_38760 [Arctium lappa]|uniref:Uncharacterized protein n=1 Tax=Arctium lappa TaxID=4217 RepID=A0ACB8XUJ1_ARCLA|nr:hypothetical protein L6452_38760 [Arctium lappa]